MRTRYALITMASVLILVIGLPVGSVTGSVADARTRPACTITGTHRDDRLRGTTGPDVICALRGEDRVYGRGGDDVIYGGLGRDHLLGQAGDDRVYGGGMDDGLRGNRGDDQLFGQRGRDDLDETTALTCSSEAAVTTGCMPKTARPTIGCWEDLLETTVGRTPEMWSGPCFSTGIHLVADRRRRPLPRAVLVRMLRETSRTQAGPDTV